MAALHIARNVKNGVVGVGLVMTLFLSSLTRAMTKPKVENPDFDKEIHRLVDKFHVAHISVADFAKLKKEQNILILDTRERKEFETSHIPGAKFNGPNNIDHRLLEATPKNRPIILYCSVGYRSSRLAEKLQKMGYTKVRNLWGSVFEWTNQGHPLVDSKNAPTTKIHTYDANWSRWVHRGDKVW